MNIIVKEVEIPEYGKYYIRRFSAAAVLKLQKLEGNEVEAHITGVLHGLVDAGGKRVYADDQVDEIENMDWNLLRLLGAEILELQGIKKAAIDDAIKNSDPNPSASLPTA